MPEANLEIDAASALHLGSRATQEDAIATDFPIGGECGLVVLADGMGGHTAGEVASKIAVTEVYSELKLATRKLALEPGCIPAALRQAAESANGCLRCHSEVHPETVGMGTTLVATVQVSNALHWISIGDSLLLLFRNGKLRRLNADHSLAPQIDLMVEKGELQRAVAENHPQRNCLISAMTGEQIPKIDCPDTPIRLLPGDVIIVATDGLHALTEDTIASVLAQRDDLTSSEIARDLIKSVTDFDDPDQDNLACAVAKVCDPRRARVVSTDMRGRRTPVAGATNGATSPDAPSPETPAPRPPILQRLRRITGIMF